MFATFKTKRLTFLVLLSVTQNSLGCLIQEAPFLARLVILFLVAEIDAQGCAPSVLPHSSFPRLIRNFSFCLVQMVTFSRLFLAIRLMAIFELRVWWSMNSPFCLKCQNHLLFCCRTEQCLVSDPKCFQFLADSASLKAL